MNNYILLYPLLLVLRLFRKLINTSGRFYALMHTAPVQPLLEYIGRLKGYEVYLRAQRTTPAYIRFLHAEQHKTVSSMSDWAKIPLTTKENYVKKYSIEDRCQGGAIPTSGVVIDESSGSSGTPNSWVRNVAERTDVKRMLQLALGLTFRHTNLFVLNCFALGPWATGMNVSMSLVDIGIMKSIGPDKLKLENALRQFGPKYHYLVTGYPPFIKNFVDSTELDLSRYTMDLVVGGEAISEGLRSYLLRSFRTVRSSYGASDLEINIGAETDFTIALRRQLLELPEVCLDIFGKSQPPMIFQYDPADYIIETNAESELVYTITRFHNAAPKIRYNLHDIGSVLTYRVLSAKLAKYDISLDAIAAPHSKFPVLCIFGRGDLTVPFYGAKIFTADIEKIINENPILVKQLNTFQLKSYDDDKLNRRLHIALEQVRGGELKLSKLQLREIFYEGLKANNQDFREVTRMFTPESVEIEVVGFGLGPFADRDIRVKNKYIAA